MNNKGIKAVNSIVGLVEKFLSKLQQAIEMNERQIEVNDRKCETLCAEIAEYQDSNRKAKNLKKKLEDFLL